jgi:hypothetical protein
VAVKPSMVAPRSTGRRPSGSDTTWHAPLPAASCGSCTAGNGRRRAGRSRSAAAGSGACGGGGGGGDGGGVGGEAQQEPDDHAHVMITLTAIRRAGLGTAARRHRPTPMKNSPIAATPQLCKTAPTGPAPAATIAAAVVAPASSGAADSTPRCRPTASARVVRPDSSTSHRSASSSPRVTRVAASSAQTPTRTATTVPVRHTVTPRLVKGHGHTEQGSDCRVAGQRRQRGRDNGVAAVRRHDQRRHARAEERDHHGAAPDLTRGESGEHPPGRGDRRGGQHRWPP